MIAVALFIGGIVVEFAGLFPEGRGSNPGGGGGGTGLFRGCRGGIAGGGGDS